MEDKFGMWFKKSEPKQVNKIHSAEEFIKLRKNKSNSQQHKTANKKNDLQS